MQWTPCDVKVMDHTQRIEPATRWGCLSDPSPLAMEPRPSRATPATISLARSLRHPLTTLIAIGILVGLLVALTGMVAVAAPPRIGFDDGTGQVIGLDRLDQDAAPTTLDPQIVAGPCFPTDCLGPAGRRPWLSKVATFNQIGFLPK